METLCKDVAAVQQLAKVFGSNTSNAEDQKEVNLTSADGKKSGKRGDLNKKQSKDKDSRGSKMDKSCNHCGKKGHLEKSCWVKNPDKAPKWVREKVAKNNGETSMVSTDVMLCMIELNSGVFDGKILAMMVENH